MSNVIPPPVVITHKHFLRISHRGFGKKAYPRYQNKKTLQYVHNQLTGLELGIERGANTIELDISKTNDGIIVTAHGFPLYKRLPQTKEEYLRKYPEALTFQELLDWMYHQDIKLILYLELKSPITVEEVLLHITTYAKEIKENRHEVLQRFHKQLIFYSHNLQLIKSLIEEKQRLGLRTGQIRIVWVSLKLITTDSIDLVAQIGGKNCKLYGVEQGMVLWGKIFSINILQSPFLFFPPFSYVKKYFQNLSSIVRYAQKQNLLFIVGTVNNLQLVQLLMEQGVNGIVPDDPSIFFFAGIAPQNIELYKEDGRYYIPPSMKKRLNIQ